MKEQLTACLDGLSPGRLEEAARHFEQTRYMCYGGAERQTTLVFRLPFDHPDVIDHSAPAASSPSWRRRCGRALQGDRPG